MIYHVSDRSGIDHFEPRRPPSFDVGITDDVVWGVDDRLLPNYLVPRDCPRVTFHAASTTTPADTERFFSGASMRHVVAIETAWLDRVRTARLWIYELPSRTFELVDRNAGYLVSRDAVRPIGVTEINDLPEALAARNVELRVLPSLWILRDAVATSTLRYSFIRMKNASPR
jgi:hypothetical protein